MENISSGSQDIGMQQRTHSEPVDASARPIGNFSFPPSQFSPFGFPFVPPGISAAVTHFLRTGDLKLTKENAYPLLFWGHVLQMPLIVELSRLFLLQESLQNMGTSANAHLMIPPREHHLPEEPPELNFPSTSEASNDDSEYEIVEPATVHQEMPLEAVISKSTSSKDDQNVERCCCDGPVTFQRVLNENYGVTINESQADMGEDPYEDDINSEDGPKNLTNFAQHPSHFIAKSLHQQRRPRDTYKCLYCHHSFKSYYCYQKHKRRHINPVTVEGQGPIDPSRVQLKDLNVQYFPCKTCGAKFPSYYFVHKHRKTCHPEDIQSTSEFVNPRVDSAPSERE